MKTRWISAIIIMAIIIPLIILGGLYLKIFACILAAAAAYEFMNIRKKDKKIPLLMMIPTYIVVIFLTYFGVDLYSVSYSIDINIIIGLLLIFLLPVVLINENKKYNVQDALYLIGISLFLGLTFNIFLIIRDINITYILYLFLISVATDTFAYYTGYYVGKHKLCPKISPNKTIEGSLGGAIMGTLIPTLFYLYVINPDINIFVIISITLLLSTIGQIGDLFFSSIKRNYDQKDFSNLIPGHGGILDRIDSFIFITITYFLFINIL